MTQEQFTELCQRNILGLVRKAVRIPDLEDDDHWVSHTIEGQEVDLCVCLDGTEVYPVFDTKTDTSISYKVL